MKLPHLDQGIDLYRGEAGELGQAIYVVWQRALTQATGEQPRPLAAALLLALPVLQRVGRRLHERHQREQLLVGPPSRRPQRFRLRYDEVVALMLYVFPEPGPVALVPLGRVQQAALNLERWVDFSAVFR